MFRIEARTAVQFLDSVATFLLPNQEVPNLQERDLWGGLGVDGRTILEWTLKR
jgi:hypothetical protein